MPVVSFAHATLPTSPGSLELADGRRVVVADGLVLGRGKDCDVVLEDTKASRRHARLIVLGSVVEIEDLGSSNGTLLNGHRVQRRLLRSGDELTIGTTTVRYVEEAGAAAAPPASEPAPGEDLFGDDESPAPPIRGEDPLGGADAGGPLPGAGLEGDPFAGRQAPPPAQPEPTAPQPPSSSRGAPPPPPSRSAPPSEDVDVLEFEDEVVEVRKRPAAAPPPPSPQPTVRAASRAAPAALHAQREHGVLRGARSGSDRRGLLGDDMRQMSLPQRALLVLAALAVAALLGWIAMRLVQRT